MNSYRQSGGWEDAAASGIVGLVVVAAIVIAAFLATTVIVILTEIARVYQARALKACRSRPILWLALVGMLACWLIGTLLMQQPATLSLGVYLCAWSFLVYVVIVEGCDWYEQRFDAPAELAPPEVTIDQLVAPWHEMPAMATGTTSPASATGSNGHHRSMTV